MTLEIASLIWNNALEISQVGAPINSLLLFLVDILCFE